MAMGTTITIEPGALYRLMTWLSPAYPTGAFSYSHGLEYAVEAGLVGNAAELSAWLATVIRAGGGWIDSLLLAESWRAAFAGDRPRLAEAAILGAAWRGTAEMALESEAQGRAFLVTTRAAWPHPLLDGLAAEGVVVLPVAVGAATGAAAIALAPSILAYLQSFSSNLVSAALRLIPLGQTDGQRIIADLAPVILETGRRALAAKIEEAGSAAPLIDWCSMRHETQYTRLFRS